MRKEVKKNIRLLADKFNHNIEFEKDILILKSGINIIKIWEEDKYGVNVSYNMDEEIIELKIPQNQIYDLLIDLFRRMNNQIIINPKSGILLTIEEWIKEEGESARKKIDKLKKDLKMEKIQYRNLGGNRYEAEYYYGILILIDDLCWASSNVLKI